MLIYFMMMNQTVEDYEYKIIFLCGTIQFWAHHSINIHNLVFHVCNFLSMFLV